MTEDRKAALVQNADCPGLCPARSFLMLLREDDNGSFLLRSGLRIRHDYHVSDLPIDTP